MLQGVLAPGMKIGPDGAMYLTDWVTGWSPTGKGRVWKLDSTSGKNSAARREVQALLQENFTARPVPRLVELLRHEDQRVRLKAQFELVRRGDQAALAAAATAAQTTHEGQLSRVHAIWGLGQLLRGGTVPPSLLTPLLGDSDPEIRAQAAKVLGHARSTAAATAIAPLVSDVSPRVRSLATIALGRIGYRAAMPAVVAMLAADNEQDVYLRNAGVVALTAFGDRDALAALSTHTSRGVRLAAVAALRRLQDPGVARFLQDADPLVVTEAARAINDEGGIVAALPALARLLERDGLDGVPLVRRAISANLRVGDAASAARVGAYARRAGLPEALRIEAIATLGVWAAPSNMDRVDGSWIAPLGQRDATGAQAAVTELASLITDTATSGVKVAWIEAVAKLGVKSQAGAVLARLQSDRDATVRVAALRALDTLAAPELERGVRAAMADSDASVRSAAIDVLAGTSMPAAAKVDLLMPLVTSGSTAERQSALHALGTVRGDAAVAALGRLADGLETGAVDPAVQLDLVEAIQASKAAPLQAHLERLKIAADLANIGEVLPQALSAGGSAGRGAQVVYQHPSAQCGRCHTIGQGTANVGPNLTHIGSQLTRAQLVEALVNPSARLAPGYGHVSVTLRNGRKLEGTLTEESDTMIAIEDATQGVQRVPVADIAARVNSPSAMPPMNLLLTPREIRDVVEFLASQK
jgi:putative heme-binding domain-containing protein